MRALLCLCVWMRACVFYSLGNSAHTCPLNQRCFRRRSRALMLFGLHVIKCECVSCSEVCRDHVRNIKVKG